MPVGDVLRAELEARGALDTVEGQVALRLAEQLDAPRNGMAVAGDAKALASILAEIRERNVTEVDPIDELDARRKNRGATAEAV